MKPLQVAVQVLFLISVGVQAPAQAPPQTPPTVSQASQSQNGDAPELGDVISRVNVNNIVAPVLVTDRAGNIIDGLQPS